MDRTGFGTFTCRCTSDLGTLDVSSSVTKDDVFSSDVMSSNLGGQIQSTILGRCGGVNCGRNVGTPFGRRPRTGAVMFAPLDSVSNIAKDVKPFFYRFALGKSVLPRSCPTACTRRFTRFLNVTGRKRTGFCDCVIYAMSTSGLMEFDNCCRVFFRMLGGMFSVLNRGRKREFLGRVHPRVVRLTGDSHHC